MALENPRRQRLLREALGADGRLPSAGATYLAIFLVALVVCIIAVGSYALPDNNSAAGVAEQRYATSTNANPPPAGE